MVEKITMASLCIYNFLCERRYDAYSLLALVDYGNADHQLIEGASP